MAIEGPLKELNIHDVFQLLDLGRKTGILRVTSELRQNSGAVYFEHGAIVGAEVTSNPHPLGGLLLKSGRVSQEDLTRARAMQAAGDQRRLGEILVAIGAVSPRELERVVRAQVEEVIFELMSWSEGYFSFGEGDAVAAVAEASIRIPTEAVLMEAARRIDEWSQIEARIPHLGVVPRFAPASHGAGTLDLRPDEWALLAEVDGTRSLREIAVALGRSGFDVAKAVYGLAVTGILAVEDPAAGGPAAASEPRLTMLVAQAEEALAVGDVSAALAAAEAAAAASPEHPVGHLLRGRALLAAGRFEPATEAFRDALRLDPLSAAAYRLLGFSLVAQGRFRDAVDAWDRWMELGDATEEQALAASVAEARRAALTLDEAIRGGRD